MSIEKLKQNIDKLEQLIAAKLANNNNISNETLEKLEQENRTLKQEYQNLKQTSQEVINELNNSIAVIDEYFKKQNANS